MPRYGFTRRGGTAIIVEAQSATVSSTDASEAEARLATMFQRFGLSEAGGKAAAAGRGPTQVRRALSAVTVPSQVPGTVTEQATGVRGGAGTTELREPSGGGRILPRGGPRVTPERPSTLAEIRASVQERPTRDNAASSLADSLRRLGLSENAAAAAARGR